MERALAAILLCASLLLSGCALTTPSGVWAPFVNEKSLVKVGDTTVAQTKVGTAQAEGILFFAWGDTSLSTACKNCPTGEIKRVHHVDAEELNVFGVYARKIIKVIGD